MNVEPDPTVVPKDPNENPFDGYFTPEQCKKIVWGGCTVLLGLALCTAVAVAAGIAFY